ncbi:MAG: efflux RND transporter permease subunit [Phycisphaerales bacterium]|nr:efflux RND transporter permease subunit [Phycisphaerales bacterium]
MNQLPSQRPGLIGWMCRNPVAANLLMITFIVGGLLMAGRLKQEVFPEFSIDMVIVTAAYPGAGPEEVEQGVMLAIEGAVESLDGVRRVSSTSGEGGGSVIVELLRGVDTGKALQDVKTAVDRITSFPVDMERPTTSLFLARNRVLSLVVHGDTEERTLRDLARSIREEVMQLPGITWATLNYARPLEIEIEVPGDVLRSMGLTLGDLATIVRGASIDLPAGEIRTDGGRVLVRTNERRDLARDFDDIPVVVRPDGTLVTLGMIADVRETFAQQDLSAFFNGQPAMSVEVFRVGHETPIGISGEAARYVADRASTLPPGIELDIWNDDSVIYRERIDLLMRNAFVGLALVLLMLGLFLEPRLAFWVMLGIPISILGSFLFIPLTGATINMISLFAFIVTLGIIVDDAIMVGENIHERRQSGVGLLTAAIEGAREIAMPVFFAVTTNIVAFAPMFFVPGGEGKLFMQIPAITISVFVVSLIESLLVLPAHLSHEGRDSLFWRTVSKPSRYCRAGLAWVIDRCYGPVSSLCFKHRYSTIAAGVALLLISAGYVAGGWIPFSFMPSIDSGSIIVSARLPVDAPRSEADKLLSTLQTSFQTAVRETGMQDAVVGEFSVVGANLNPFGPVRMTGSDESLVSMWVLFDPSLQTVDSGTITAAWQRAAGSLPGVETITFRDDFAGNEKPLEIRLAHKNRDTLDAAAEQVASMLRGYEGVRGVDSGVATGKPQLNFTLTSEGRAAGLTTADAARQGRDAIHGAEVLRQQRDRDEMRVVVRLPEAERSSLGVMDTIMLRTPGGGEMPLSQAMHIERGQAQTSIHRVDGRRVIAVEGEVDDAVTNANQVVLDLAPRMAAEVGPRYPGLVWSFEGEYRDQMDTFEDLGTGYAMAMLVIFGLLAIPFKSYVQPLIVMSAIPFGFIGALIGHILLGYNLNIITMFGVVALSGVVVNDSLVLVVTANRWREANPGGTALQAMLVAGRRRFRPIFLTSVTTFCGLSPMIFETSIQAKFLVPMAIAIGFGILFATVVILLIVPALYIAVDDLRRWCGLILQPEPDEGSPESNSQ